MEGGAEQDGAAKKSPFDGLDRDELILKLKGLLSVYKNAKQAKDELGTENTELKETLASMQLQKSADKEYLKGLQSSIQKLNETVAILEEQKILDKNYMKGMHEMVDEVTNEKNILSNRVTRLSQENEQLLGDCRKSDTTLKQLNESLVQMCQQQKTVNTDLRKNHALETAKNDKMEAQLSQLRSKCDAYESKLKLYRTKLVDFSGQLKGLRICKNVLLTTVKEYSQAVSKWQGEILTVSNEFFEKNRDLQEEKRVLEERVTSLSVSSGECDRCDESLKKYEDLVVHFEKIVRDNMELGALVKSIESQRPGASVSCDVMDSNQTDSTATYDFRDQDIGTYRAMLLQLDESLNAVHLETIHYQDLHKKERQLLENKCVDLENVVLKLNSQLEKSTQQQSTQLDASHAKTEELIQTIDALNYEIEQVKGKLVSDKSAHEEIVQDRDSSISEKSLQIADLESNIQSLRNDLDLVRSDNALIKSKFEGKFGEQMDEFKRKESETNELNHTLNLLREESKATISRLQDNLSEVTSELAASKLCIEDMKVNVQKINAAAEVSHELSVLQSKSEGLVQTIQALENELALERSAHAELLHGRDSTIADYSSRIVSLESTVKSLEVSIESAHSSNSEMNFRLKNVLEEHVEEVKSKEFVVNEAMQTLKLESETTLSKLQDNLSEVTIELAASKLCIDDLREQLNQFNETKDVSLELSTIQTKSDELIKTIEYLKAENQQERKELESIVNSLKDGTNSYLTSQKESFLTAIEEQGQILQSKNVELCEIANSLDTLRNNSTKTITQLQADLKQESLELDAAKMFIEDLQDKLKKSNDDSDASQELSALQSKLQELKQIIEISQTETQQTKDQLALEKSSFATALSEKDSIIAESQNVIADKSQTIDDFSHKLDKLSQEFINLKTIEQQHEHQQQLLRSELKEAEQKSVDNQSGFQKQLEEKEAAIKSKQLEMDDLLSEMRELNEALRNRGDIISKQEQKISGLNAEVEEITKYVGNLMTEHEQLAERLREAESLPKINDISCDQLSTSTVSRIEEVARMRDIDDSFEEKYNKLRSIAVRLKKKISEQTKRIEELEATYPLEAQTSSATKSPATPIDVQLRNVQQLQKHNDQLQDELESIRSVDKQNAKTCEQLSIQLAGVTAELSVMKMVNDEIKNTAAASCNQKSSLDQAVKEYVKQIVALKEELMVEKKQKQSTDDELVQLKEKIKCQADELTKVSADLKKVRSSVKKSNVLSLEMEAQEKSLNEISQKLETKNLQVDELNLTIKQQEETIVSLKHQIHIIEKTVASEKEHALELKQQLDLQQARLKEVEHDKSELKIHLDELQHEKSTTNAELVESRLSAEQSISENEKCLALLRSENMRHLQRISELDETVVDLSTKFRNTDQELMDLKTEFVAYKVRAQSMLRQNQQKESSREVELEDELNTIQATNESLNNKLKASLDQNKSLDANMADLRQECDRLQAHSKHLMQLVDESRLNSESLQDEVRRQNIDHQEALKSQRLQIDTLSSCYKKEIAELTEKHERDLLVKSQQIRLQDENRNSRPTLNEITSKGATQRSPPTTDEQRIDWLLMERQDAEGSESNQPQSNFPARKLSTTRGKRDLIPLDELLNSSFETTTFTDGSSSPTFDLQATKDRLHVQESRVKHLTTLLAEAEQDTARLTQLNDALKEEVRRQERSAEREKHLHNLEYLKNVMFKFLTIHNGDEKVHLVPVLNTMLKLSPEETQKLQNVAKGIDGSQRGWRGYLPV